MSMSKPTNIPKPASQRGFTIIELLVATLIFSIILIVITAGVLSFTRQYYRGLVESKTQAVARQIMDDVVRTIQYNPGNMYPIGTPTSGYCIGSNVRYSFARNIQVIEGGGVPASHQGNHGLIKDKVNGCNTGTAPIAVASEPAVLASGRREVLGERMRLVKFIITPSSAADSYKVTVRVAYGDDDVLCSPTVPAANPGGCDNNGGDAAGAMYNSSDVKCKLKAGNQFCAVSELTTVVNKRVD
jgi:prepilin-type N-terminal cleavage/methylation domain-containing protein